MKDLQEDNLFRPIRERLGGYEEAPSEGLWDKIATRKRERVWPLFLEPVGIVLIGMVLFLSSGEEVTNDEMTKVKIKEVTKDEVAKVITEDEVEVYQENKTTEAIAQANPETDPETKTETKTVLLPTPVRQNEITQVQQSQITNHESQITSHESEITNHESPTEKDSTGVTSPIILPKKDSTTVTEVTPPYKKPKSRYQLSVAVTPSLSFQKIIPTDNDEIIIEGFEPRSPLSIKRFGFSIDAGIQKDINKILGFYGGLSFYRQHQELTYTYFNKEAEVTRVGESWTFEISRVKQTRTFDYTMTNIGVRSGLLVTVKGDKLKHKFGAGLMYAYNLNSSANYLAYQLSYRNELTINERISWFIEPVFTYSFLTKEKLDEPFKLKPYRAGISTGILYRF